MALCDAPYFLCGRLRRLGCGPGGCWSVSAHPPAACAAGGLRFWFLWGWLRVGSARRGWVADRGSVAVMKVPELLDLLDRIEGAAINGDVVEALLLCQKLGGDADSAELLDWAKQELKGYSEEVSLPEYRWVRASMLGDGAAPGTRVRGTPIPLDVLPGADREAFSAGVPIVASILEIQELATREKVACRPNQAAGLLSAINASNTGTVVFDDIYFQMPGPALSGVIAAVRSRMVGLVTQLRTSLPDDAQQGQASVQAALSEAIAAPTVNIQGSHNALIMGDGSAAGVGAVVEVGSPAEPKRKTWRWLKRVLEAVTGVGTVVAFLGGGSINPI